jgi:hypothetical protein
MTDATLDDSTASKPVSVDLSVLIDQFEQAEQETRDERELSERDRDYYDGKQLSDEELQALSLRKQPAVVSNRIAPKVDALLGHERRMRTDPRAYPRTPKHEEEAQSATDAIRFVCDENKYSLVRSSAADCLFVEGIGAVSIAMRVVGGERQVSITDIPWDRFYRDPCSRRRDFSDAKFKGITIWMDESDALREFKGKEDAISGCYSPGIESETYGDRPKVQWGDSKRKRIRVLQHWFMHEGQWHTAIFCKGGYLRDPQVSPYVDENGVPQCAIVATSAYIDRENRRYGVVRRMISPQDEINKRKSKSLHLLNSKQVIYEEGSVEDLEAMRREVARPDGAIKVRPGMRFDIVDGLALAQGQMALLQEAKAEIDASGVNPAIEGDASAPSGRAQEMMLTSGLAEMSGMFEALRMMSWEVYRQVWYRIRQYWTEERWIRVTDDERNLRWVSINKPLRAWEKAAQEAEQAGQPLSPEELQQLQADPMMQQVVATQNQLAELDIDLILEDGPDSVTIQSEQYEQLVELKKADPAAIPTKAIIEASSLRNKDQILEQMEQGGIPPQVQQQMQEMQQALQEAQQQLQQAQSDKAGEMLKLQIERYKAVTDRIKVLGAIPPDIPDGWQGDASTQQIPDQAPPPSGVFVGQ